MRPEAAAGVNCSDAIAFVRRLSVLRALSVARTGARRLVATEPDPPC